MATAIRPIGHEDRLSLVEHLDELRTRLIICVLVLCAAFAVALWQNHALLRILNDPLKETTKSAAAHARGPLGAQARYDLKQREALRRSQAAFTLLAQSRAGLSPAERAALTSAAQASGAALRAAPKEVTGRQPVTLGLGEPFGQTLTVSFYFALLFALPFILYQAYAFVLPAFSPREKKIALPMMLLVPVLFIGGVAFAYFVALPRAVDFLQNFNDDNFDILIRAADYYKFSVILMALIGLMFQIPVGVLAV